jgi:hypothetical protein
MQATIHSLQRIGRPNGCQPVQRRKAMLLSPRTGVLPRPHPVVRRHYSLDFGSGPDKVADTVNTAGTGGTGKMASGAMRTGPRASDLLPHQIQQVLRVSKGMACHVGQPAADMQAQLLIQASHDEAAACPANLAPGDSGSARFAKVVSLYDPDEEHRQEKPWLIPIPSYVFVSAGAKQAKLRVQSERMAPGTCVNLFQTTQHPSTISS